MFGQFAFVNDEVKTDCPKNEHAIQCTKDIKAVINETIKKSESTLPNIKYFTIELM